jgi:hypothetical protein
MLPANLLQLRPGNETETFMTMFNNYSSPPPDTTARAKTHMEGALPAKDYRNLRFKLVPSIVEGPWMVRTAVPCKPVILGKQSRAAIRRWSMTDVHG